MTDKEKRNCPLCGADPQPACRGLYECGSSTGLRGGIDHEGRDCLARQVALRDGRVEVLERALGEIGQTRQGFMYSDRLAGAIATAKEALREQK